MDYRRLAAYAADIVPVVATAIVATRISPTSMVFFITVSNSRKYIYKVMRT
jgi:hypothetical protein